ncbi:MAG: hypothetical protein U9Q82_04530 [Chloroflexota bacterium]|nr:hypothetical protein [Chloroflexota bacterium]
MRLLIFLGSISLSVFAFELLTGMTRAASTLGRKRTLNGVTTEVDTAAPIKRRSTWDALILAAFPKRFDPRQAKDMANVVNLLRRAGYPYDTPGAFYTAAMRTFSIYLAVGGLLAGALAFMGNLIAAPIIAAIFIFLGLRKPYTKMRQLAKQRAETMRNNMLIGLSVLSSLLSSGVGLQDALRRTSGVGGPFCNLLGLLVARMEVESFSEAIQTTEAHIPDPNDIEVALFLGDVRDFFTTNRPILSSVQALQASVHRILIEDTEARASMVRQRSGLFGILSIVGLIFSLVGPFMGAF